MKRFLMMFLAFMMGVTCFTLAESKEAEAQISVELLGKLGGAGNFFDQEFLGDSRFDVSGGLRIAGIARFANGFGVGLDFDWTMTDQRLDTSLFVQSMGDRNKRYVTVQLPSIGLTFRYEFLDMFEAGVWFNYGFGSVSFDPISPSSKIVDKDGNMTGEEYALAHNYMLDPKLRNKVGLDYELQSFQMGLLFNCHWYIPGTTFAVLVGAELKLAFSRMLADDSRMVYMTNYHDQEGLDENSVNTAAFHFTFGVGYDIYLDSFGKALPSNY